VTSETPYDLLVVGGGINGAGIACDAAGRGLSVMLCEAGDLAGATSSASSKLVHGGLRYLEQYEFGLVRAALKEREVLLAKAPHIVWPLRFVLPHVAGMRPAWLLRAGLFLYDHLYRRQRIPGSTALDLTRARAGEPLTDGIARGFAYWDCWVDDARLVVLNARAAAAMRADIRPRTRVLAGEVRDGLWQVRISDGGSEQTVRARAVVNAAGPWTNDIMRRFTAAAGPVADNATAMRLVKGSHIVVPKIHDLDDAYILQNDDKRIVFVLPYERDFSLIGTTDVPFDADPAAVAIDDGERDYLIDIVGRYFKRTLTVGDIRWSYAGVRPLYDSQDANPSEVTRDYKLKLTNGAGQPPMLSVLGGKITTYRKLAEQAMDKLADAFPEMGPAWTAGATLPGGDIGGDPAAFAETLRARHTGLDAEYLGALARRHGSLADDVLGDANTMDDLGADLGGGLYEREALYMKTNEWARSPDDVLWRRSKTGLHMTAAQRDQARDRLAAML